MFKIGLWLFGICYVLSGAASARDAYLILSVDGGGVRGLVPLTMLHVLESRLGVKSGDLFDCFAGSSTGGIISVALTMPEAQQSGRAMWWARDLQRLYLEHAPRIFSRSWSHAVATLDGLLGPKYDNLELVNISDILMGTSCLSNLMKDVLITSFDLVSHRSFLFQNFGPNPSKDYPLKDVILSTSAAPVYFPSHYLDGHNLEDGGILANNPAAWVLLQCLQRPELSEAEIYLLSLGTGEFEMGPINRNKSGLLSSLNPLIDDLFEAYDEGVQELFRALQLRMPIHYIRWQPRLENPAQYQVDNVNMDNMLALEKLSEEYAMQQMCTEEFAALLKLLEARATVLKAGYSDASR